MGDISTAQQNQRQEASKAAARARIKKIVVDPQILDEVLRDYAEEQGIAKAQGRDPQMMVDSPSELMCLVDRLRHGGAKLRREETSIVATIGNSDWALSIKK